MWNYLAWIIIGYLSGSVLYGYLVPKLFFGINIREVSDDHNPGTYNTMVHCGKKAGYSVAALDVFKGAIPVYLAMKFLDITNPLFSLVIVAPVVGHGYSCFANFKGGKCLGVSYGVLLGLCPYHYALATLCFMYLFCSKVIAIFPHFARSVIIYGVVALTNFLHQPWLSFKLGVLFMCVIVIIKHYHPLNGMRLRVEVPWLKKA